MKTRFLHILACLLLVFIAGCRSGVPVEESQQDSRIVNLSLGITTRADDVNTSDIPDVLYLWIFNEEDKSCLYFTKIENPQFSGVDIQGNPVHTVDVKLLTTNGANLKFYAVLNDVNQFDTFTSLDKLEKLTFALSTYESDNKVPMSGVADLTIESTSNDYLVEIPAERAVAKLELFVTKNTPSSILQITSITLSNNPQSGILFKDDWFKPEITENPPANLVDSSIDISASLSEADAASSDELYLFEGDERKLHKITLMNPYLLENPSGDEDIILDNGLITDERYYITLSYTLSGSPVQKKIYLTKMERNTLNKVFIRIKEKVFDIEFTYKVMPWEMVVLTPEF